MNDEPKSAFSEDGKSHFSFPADLLWVLLLPLISLYYLLVGEFVSRPLWDAIERARTEGDFAVFWIATVMAAIGCALLFCARLPLYRKRLFFCIGPGRLDASHRAMYRWAYIFIVPSVILLGLLQMEVRL